MQQLNKQLRTFLAEKEFDTKKIIEEVNEGKMIVDELSEKLRVILLNRLGFRKFAG